jgi:hypothetical protein
LHGGFGFMKTSLLVFQKLLHGDCKMLRNIPFAILPVTRRSAYERFWVFWSFWKKAFWGARRIGIGVLA